MNTTTLLLRSESRKSSAEILPDCPDSDLFLIAIQFKIVSVGADTFQMFRFDPGTGLGPGSKTYA